MTSQSKNNMPKKETKTDDFTETSAISQFRERCELALAEVKDIEHFRESDVMVNYVFTIGRELFDTPLDQHNTDGLLRRGGKLAGAYVYLGQQSAYARAERDVYAQKADEHDKAVMLELIHDKDMKVTEARATAKEVCAPMKEIAIQKDVAKNQWENITEATEKMVSFIQSAIKVKEGERYQSSRVQDNG